MALGRGDVQISDDRSDGPSRQPSADTLEDHVAKPLDESAQLSVANTPNEDDGTVFLSRPNSPSLPQNGNRNTKPSLSPKKSSLQNANSSSSSPSSSSPKGNYRASIRFSKTPECPIEVEIVNANEPGPNQPILSQPNTPVAEARRGRPSLKFKFDLSQDETGRYTVYLPPCAGLNETHFYFTICDVPVWTAPRLASQQVEIMRALTLIAPVDVFGPDNNMRKFLKLGQQRWVFDRAKVDGQLCIRQVLHFACGFGVVVWSVDCLRVVFLDSFGPVEEWNRKNLENNIIHSCIEVNDFIIEVNNKRMAHEMMKDMASNVPLEMVILREPPKFPEETLQSQSLGSSGCFAFCLGRRNH